jgi:regulator of replication initiation timing
MNGGDIDRNALVESFARIKEDIARLNSELYDLKLEHKKVLEENLKLKQVIVSDNTPSKEIIGQIVAETLKKVGKEKSPDAFIAKLNKKRKIIIQNRIHMLAGQNLPLPEIKDIIVEQEGLCSKATFYRYVEKLKKKGMIDIVKINDSEVAVKVI